VNIQDWNKLSPSWRQLIRHCARLNFGHIANLVFQNGEPKGDFRTIKTFHPGKDNGPSRLFFEAEESLRPQWVEIMVLVQSRPSLRVVKFEVAHGLPLKLQVEEETEAANA